MPVYMKSRDFYMNSTWKMLSLYATHVKNKIERFEHLWNRLIISRLHVYVSSTHLRYLDMMIKIIFAPLHDPFTMLHFSFPGHLSFWFRDWYQRYRKIHGTRNPDGAVQFLCWCLVRRDVGVGFDGWGTALHPIRMGVVQSSWSGPSWLPSASSFDEATAAKAAKLRDSHTATRTHQPPHGDPASIPPLSQYIRQLGGGGKWEIRTPIQGTNSTAAPTDGICWRTRCRRSRYGVAFKISWRPRDAAFFTGLSGRTLNAMHMNYMLQRIERTENLLYHFAFKLFLFLDFFLFFIRVSCFVNCK